MNQKSDNPIDLSVSSFDTQYRKQGMGAQRSYPNESLIQFIASRFFKLAHQERKEIRVLEVGCGSGANLWMMAKEGLQVYGLDSSLAALNLAKQHLEEKWKVSAELKQGNFTDLPYENDYFDAVVDVVSFQHLPIDYALQALAEVARVLKPGGEFFSYRLSDKCSMNVVAANRIDEVTLFNIDDPTMPLANNGPTAFWSIDLVDKLYKAVGIQVTSIEKVSRTYVSGMFVEYLVISSIFKKAVNGKSC
jgi:ubiquinone/menaquinone biosynthesis C-methylase UbiE